ncbi:MAG: DUF1043 family protein [Wenzhouxiangellaceae bacterium]|nr:DUF1043 family protein [Wenzhouxiangellaceae bacterium]
MEFAIWLIVGVVIGGAVGAALTWWFAGRGSGGSVEKLKRENDAFREQVNEHFVETAQLINQLTDSYKAVFDHLSGGAEKLVDKKAIAERMPRVSDREVRLRHLGAPEQTGKTAGTGQRSQPGQSDNSEKLDKPAKPDSGTGNPSASGKPGARPAGTDPLKQRPGDDGLGDGGSSARDQSRASD